MTLGQLRDAWEREVRRGRRTGRNHERQLAAWRALSEYVDKRERMRAVRRRLHREAIDRAQVTIGLLAS